jgi:hypothetical protein
LDAVSPSCSATGSSMTRTATLRAQAERFRSRFTSTEQAPGCIGAIEFAFPIHVFAKGIRVLELNPATVAAPQCETSGCHSWNALAIKSCSAFGMLSRVASSRQPATASCPCFNNSFASRGFNP